jgi:hypothetical protein
MLMASNSMLTQRTKSEQKEHFKAISSSISGSSSLNKGAGVVQLPRLANKLAEQQAASQWIPLLPLDSLFLLDHICADADTSHRSVTSPTQSGRRRTRVGSFGQAV